MPNSLNKPKTVAILGAGPVGLAAAAHVLERGMEPIVLEARPAGRRTPCANGAMCRMFSPWEYNIDKAAERLLAAAGWNSPAARPISDRRRAAWRSISSRWRRARRSRTTSAPTAGSPAVGRAGFDKMKSNGRAFEPFTIRYQNGKGPEQLKADAVIDATGTWFSPNPAGADGLPAIGEDAAAGSADRLRHARRAGSRARALCRQHRRRAGRRPFGHRHADRPGATQGRGAGDRDHLAAARRPARKGVRRRRQRQARRARRAGRGLRRAGGERQDQGRDRASASRISAATASKLRIGAGWRLLRPLRRRRRAGGGHRLPARVRLPARGPAVARSRGRMPADRWRR